LNRRIIHMPTSDSVQRRCGTSPRRPRVQTPREGIDGNATPAPKYNDVQTLSLRLETRPYDALNDAQINATSHAPRSDVVYTRAVLRNARHAALFITPMPSPAVGAPPASKASRGTKTRRKRVADSGQNWHSEHRPNETLAPPSRSRRRCSLEAPLRSAEAFNASSAPRQPKFTRPRRSFETTRRNKRGRREKAQTGERRECSNSNTRKRYRRTEPKQNTMPGRRRMAQRRRAAQCRTSHNGWSPRNAQCNLPCGNEPTVGHGARLDRTNRNRRHPNVVRR